MSVLWVMPNWRAPSELWMQRMLGMVAGDLAGLACYDAPVATWGDGVPVFSLNSGYRSTFDRIVRVATLRRATPAAALRRAIAVTKPTGVLVHYLDFALAFEDELRAANAEVFVHCHGYDVNWDLRRDDDPSRAHFPQDYPAAVKRLSQTARIIANSRHTLRQLELAGVAPERVVLKYLGVEVPPAPPSRTSGERLRILFLGRLIDCKGPDLVVRAFILATSRGLDAELYIAGDGNLRSVCERLARESEVADRIHFLGFVDEATGRSLRERCHVFTAHNQTGPLSRQVEALGVSILEAMAAGMPVVTGQSGGVAELVEHGVTGVLVEPGDVEGHAAALLELAEDAGLRQSMGAAGWRRARDFFSLGRERAALRGLLGLD